MNRPWYRTADLAPQLNAWCEVRWFGREFRAMRTLWGATRAVAWVTLNKDGSFRRLPPKRYAEQWGERPLFYRPLDPTTWRWPLPAPVAEPAPNMWSSRGSGRFAAMAAQAEQSARTVEELRAEVDREYGSESGAVRAADGEDSEFTTGEHWWRDANNIVYEPRGQVSADMAEARILRFAAFVGAGRCLEDRPLAGNNAHWFAELTPEQRQMIAEFAEKEDEQRRRKRFPRLVETENDRRDEDEAGRWFLALNPPELWDDGREAWSLNTSQKLLIWRSLGPPLSWRRIGEEIDLSYEGARNRYERLIRTVRDIANDEARLVGGSLAARMAELRERNRRAKIMDAA